MPPRCSSLRPPTPTAWRSSSRVRGLLADAGQRQLERPHRRLDGAAGRDGLRRRRPRRHVHQGREDLPRRALGVRGAAHRRQVHRRRGRDRRGRGDGARHPGHPRADGGELGRRRGDHGHQDADAAQEHAGAGRAPEDRRPVAQRGAYRRAPGHSGRGRLRGHRARADRAGAHRQPRVEAHGAVGHAHRRPRPLRVRRAFRRARRRAAGAGRPAAAVRRGQPARHPDPRDPSHYQLARAGAHEALGGADQHVARAPRWTSRRWWRR